MGERYGQMDAAAGNGPAAGVQCDVTNRHRMRGVSTPGRPAGVLITGLVALGCLRGSCSTQTRCGDEDESAMPSEDSATGDTTESSASASDALDLCAAIDDEDTCEDNDGCHWWDVYTYRADALYCEREALPGWCGRGQVAPRPYPATFVDPSGAVFVDIAEDDCSGEHLLPAGWTRCEDADGAPGCTCGWIDGTEPGRRAAHTMAACDVDNHYAIEIVVDVRSSDDCDEDRAQPIIEALARGENVHVVITEQGFLYSAEVHAYARAGAGLVVLEEFSGCTGGCVSPIWRDPASCGAPSADYFASAVEERRACSLIRHVREGWGTACVGGAVACVE